jgi:hypothetical protein
VCGASAPSELVAAVPERVVDLEPEQPSATRSATASTSSDGALAPHSS